MNKNNWFLAVFVVITLAWPAAAIDMSAVEELRNKNSGNIKDAAQKSQIVSNSPNEVLKEANLMLKLQNDRTITLTRVGKAFAGDKLSQSQLIERALVDAKVSMASEICGDELDIATTKDGKKLIKISGDSSEYMDAAVVSEFSTSKGNIVFSSIRPIEGSQSFNRGDFTVTVEAVIKLDDVKKTVSLIRFDVDVHLMALRQDLMHQLEANLAENPNIDIITVPNYFDTSIFQIDASLETSAKDKDRGLFRRPKRKYSVQMNVRLIDTSKGNKTELFTAVGESEHKIEEIFSGDDYNYRREKEASNSKTNLIGLKEAAQAAIKNFCSQLQTKKIF